MKTNNPKNVARYDHTREKKSLKKLPRDEQITEFLHRSQQPDDDPAIIVRQFVDFKCRVSR